MSRIGTDQLRDAVLDEGAFVSWDSAPLTAPMSESYAGELAELVTLDTPTVVVLLGQGSGGPTLSEGAEHPPRRTRPRGCSHS